MEKTNGQIWVSSQFCKSGKPVGDEITKENMILVDTFETTRQRLKQRWG